MPTQQQPLSPEELEARRVYYEERKARVRRMLRNALLTGGGTALGTAMGIGIGETMQAKSPTIRRWAPYIGAATGMAGGVAGVLKSEADRTSIEEASRSAKQR